MELNNKEKKIKQVLSDVNYEIDTDFLWKEVSQELNKKKKRRILWFIPFGLIAVFGISYLFFNYSLTHKNNLSEVGNTNITTQNIVQQNQESQSETILKEEHSTTNTLDSQSNTSTTTEAKPTSKTNNTSYRKIYSNTENLFTASKKTIFNNSANTRINQSKILQKQNTNNLRNPSVVEKTIINEAILNTNLALLAIDKIQLATFLINRNRVLIGKEAIEPIEIKKQNTKRVFVTLGAGAIKNITTNNLAEDEFPTELFGKELELPGINTSLLVGLQTKNNWRFFGGLDYAQQVTRFTNNDTDVLQGNTTIENQVSIDETNSYQSSEGVLLTSTLIENDLTWHKKHNQLNLQIGLSKNILNNSKFSIAPELSIMQNIFASHSGYYLNEQTPYLTKFEKTEENPYRKNTGLKTQLGLNLGYQLRGLELSINTSWRNPMNNITKETNFYQTKNSQLSIQARINYILNWENK